MATAWRARLTAGAPTWDTRVVTGGHSVTNVNGDNLVSENEVVVVNGFGFGSSQGASTVKLKSGSLSVTQTITTWADTSLSFTVDSDILPFGSVNLEVIVSGNTVNFSVTHEPPSPYGWGTVDVPWTAGWYSLWDGASPAIVDGDQYQYELYTDNTALVEVLPDGTVVIDSAILTHQFDYRVFDLTDQTWSSWATATLSPEQYTSLGRGYGIPMLRRRRR